jgi:hypothetical protein
MCAAMSSALTEQLCAIVNKPDAGFEPVSGELIALARRHQARRSRR